jgi:predicted TIM-barrel fold metal-dependent hydrolase
MSGWLDVHAHYMTPRYHAECEAAGHREPDGMPGLPGWSPEQALDLMGDTGVSAAILAISSPGVHFGDDRAARDLAAHVNDAGADVVAQRPDAFGLAAVLPLPDVDGAMDELQRARTYLASDAVALKTNYHGRYLTDPDFDAVLAELDAHGDVVLLHPTSPPGWEATALGHPRPVLEFLFDTTRCVADLILAGTLTRYPAIRWVVPHAGAVLPVVAHRVAAMSVLTENPVDAPAALGSLYFDLAGFPVPVALDALLKLVSPRQLLYGSDFPFTPAPAVTALAQTLAAQESLRAADLTLAPGSAAATLFPRLLRAR